MSSRRKESSHSGDSSSEDPWQGFARKATDPDYDERKAKGPFVYQKVGNQPGRTFYQQEEQARLMAEQAASAAAAVAAAQQAATAPANPAPAVPAAAGGGGATAAAVTPAAAGSAGVAAPQATATDGGVAPQGPAAAVPGAAALAAVNAPTAAAQGAPSAAAGAAPSAPTPEPVATAAGGSAAPPPAALPPPTPAVVPPAVPVQSTTPSAAAQAVAPAPPAAPGAAPSFHAPDSKADAPPGQAAASAAPTPPAAPANSAQPVSATPPQPPVPGVGADVRQASVPPPSDDVAHSTAAAPVTSAATEAPTPAVQTAVQPQAPPVAPAASQAPPQATVPTPTIPGDAPAQLAAALPVAGQPAQPATQPAGTSPTPPVATETHSATQPPPPVATPPSGTAGPAQSVDQVRGGREATTEISSSFKQRARAASKANRLGRDRSSRTRLELAANNDTDVDVANWGHTDAHDDSGSEMQSLSSGLSARDKEWSPGRGGMRPRAFNQENGLASLVHHSNQYIASQKHRKMGVAPHAMGLADDLAARLAFESLNSLSGMACKVQETIEHNKRAFANQIALVDKQILQKAMYAWKTHRYGKKSQLDKMRRAMNRILRGCLSRAFYAWRDQFKEKDKNRAMRQKVRSTILRGLLARTFHEWRRLTDDRWWKKQLLFRDREIELLEKLCNGFRNRPIVVLRKRRLSKCMHLWYAQAERLRRKRLRLNRALLKFRNRNLSAAWTAWVDFLVDRRDAKAQMNKVIRRMMYVKLGQAYSAWQTRVAEKKENTRKLFKAASFLMKLHLGKAWNSWTSYVQWKRRKQQIIQRWKQPQKAAAFYRWLEQALWQVDMRNKLRKAAGRMRNLKASQALTAWHTYYKNVKLNGYTSNIEDMAREMKALQEENARYRRDNERFVRIIDSGEWGRGRVSELVQAGQVLKQERDQLVQLMNHLRSDYEAVEKAKVAQQQELIALKDRMRMRGPSANKMLVKGGSAFNAMTRMLKEQLAKSTAGPLDPNLLAEVNKETMQQLHFFPDELDVTVRCNAPNSAAFVRPDSQGVRSANTPRQPSIMAASRGNAGRFSGGSPRKQSDAVMAQIMNQLQDMARNPGQLESFQDQLRSASATPRPGGLNSTAPAAVRELTRDRY